MKGRAILMGIGAATLALGLAGPAGADPVNAKGAQVLPITCDGTIGQIQIAVNGNGKSTPGLVTTSNVVGIPYELHLAFTFTPSDGSTPSTDAQDLVRNAPRSGRLADCSLDTVEAVPGGTFSINGTVRISYSGAH